MKQVVGCMLALLGATPLQGCQRSKPLARPADTEPSMAPASSPPATSGAAHEARDADAAAASAGADEKQIRFQFDDGIAGQPPSGFVFGRTGKGAPGKWLVKAESDAPSAPNVLAQLDADATSFRFPVAAATEPSLANVRVTVRCKMLSGKVDQACGLVLRYQDANNYYVTRANTLENNIRFYSVKDGKREQLATWDGAVTANAWHAYGIEARGERFTVYWNGAMVLDHEDDTFTSAGRAGVWTKADSVTYFDNLAISAL